MDGEEYEIEKEDKKRDSLRGKAWTNRGRRRRVVSSEVRPQTNSRSFPLRGDVSPARTVTFAGITSQGKQFHRHRALLQELPFSKFGPPGS